MSIKQLTIKNYKEIIQLWVETGLPVRPTGRDSYDKLKYQLESGRVVILADMEDNIIRGLVLLSHDERKGWINRLAIKSQFRRQGIAKTLLEASEKYFLSIGIEIFVALIEAKNTASINFFEKNDYKKWEDIYYFSKRAKEDI